MAVIQPGASTDMGSRRQAKAQLPGPLHRVAVQGQETVGRTLLGKKRRHLPRTKVV
ncbi:hypothetical protein [Salinibacter virus M31CR41-3]|nr:hypothetical protein [Salinibacter virus M31CR41-3]